MNPRNCGYCEACGRGDYSKCTTFPITKPGEADLTELAPFPHLEPCPWCGQELYVAWRHRNPRASCETADCFGRMVAVVNLDDEGDVAAWNRRAALGTAPATPVPAGDARLAIAVDALNKIDKGAGEDGSEHRWTALQALAAIERLDAATPVQPVPALPELWHAANAVMHMLPQIDEPRTSRLYAALRDAAGAGQEAAAVHAVGAWQDIVTAPVGVLVIVGWRDETDQFHSFDYLEDEVWQNYFNEHEHYAIAGVARGRSEDAPYTHWMPMRALPAALCPLVGPELTP